MARRRFTSEQIINHLRQAEILINQGKTVAEKSREDVVWVYRGYGFTRFVS